MLKLSAAMQKVLAANIRTLRKRLDVNQTVFGEHIGVSQGTVARWEKGAEPKSEPLLKMANMAGRSVQSFTTELISDKELGSEPEPTILADWSAILMPVQLPSEDALAQMFSGLLRILKNETDADAIARRLAQLLPSALAQTVSRLSAHRGDVALDRVLEEGAQARPTANHEPQP